MGRQHDGRWSDHRPISLLLVSQRLLKRRQLPLHLAGVWVELDRASLETHMLAAEVSITPADAAFLQRAAQRGCSVHPGRPMLVAQLELMLEFMGVHTDGQ